MIDHNKPSDKLDKTIHLKPLFFYLQRANINSKLFSPSLYWYAILIFQVFQLQISARFLTFMMRMAIRANLSSQFLIIGTKVVQATSSHHLSRPTKTGTLWLRETCFTVSIVEEMMLSVGTKTISASDMILSAAAFTLLLSRMVFQPLDSL